MLGFPGKSPDRLTVVEVELQEVKREQLRLQDDFQHRWGESRQDSRDHEESHRADKALASANLWKAIALLVSLVGAGVSWAAYLDKLQ